MYVIYQMPMSIWIKSPLYSESSEVFIKDYVPVYQGELPDEVKNQSDIDVLEYLFKTFNIRHPDDYPSRSMSPGDVVTMTLRGHTRHYLCCTIGWHELKEF